MRYPPDQKARAREALLRAAESSLKANGFTGIGVDGLAAAAGVTSGAFYSNFANKEAVLQAVIEAGLGEPLMADTNDAPRNEARARLISFVRDYLTADHSLNASEGCVMPALSADVARAHHQVQDAYQRKMIALIDRIADLCDGNQADHHQRAWAIVALMVGAILVSRAIPEDSAVRTAPLDAALTIATTLIA
jgi:TetR/AcrR family transcriptional regulator, transcriptional repressor for nem operon